MQPSLQQTIRKPVEVNGIGFLTGADIRLRFLPADANHGIAFQRLDCPGTAPVPARIENTVPRQRRTAISSHGVTVEMTEHVMAALAGLEIDNCLVQLDAPEPPGGDGSSRLFVDALLDADTVTLDQPCSTLTIDRVYQSRDADCKQEISTRPLARRALATSYQLDYGARSPIRPQNLTVEVTRESFLDEICYARTFILKTEIEALRAEGYGKRTTAKDLLVFGPNGVIDNSEHVPDECVRHKILDCIGDFALCGSRLYGHVSAYRSGHRLNGQLIKTIQQAQGHCDVSQLPECA